jgi:hypothetical protein
MGQAQRQAVDRHRERMKASGLDRFEVRGLVSDKNLVRAFAKRLSEGGPKSIALRKKVEEEINQTPASRGGIYRALRESPLVGADLDLIREEVADRWIEF